MNAVNLRGLVARLTTSVRKALESAAGDALSQSHHDVEIEHLFKALLTERDSEFGQVMDLMQLDRSKLDDDLHYRLNSFRTGNDRQPGLSSGLVSLLQDALLVALVNNSREQINAFDILLAELNRETGNLGTDSLSTEFEKISLENLRQLAMGKKISVTDKKVIAIQLPPKTPAGEDSPSSSQPSETIQEKKHSLAEGGALERFTVNLTNLARDGSLDPVIGRHGDIRKVIDILCRRRQNNPLLLGDPGTGKTAVVEGLARAIVAGEVPDRLKVVQLYVLDLHLLQAGASIKGEFENRLKDVIREVQQSPQPIIVFIDEAHSLIGAGGATGQNDAANLLKPALARGEFRTIAATTWGEYRKYLEKDQALARRFQIVKIEEPSQAHCIQILRGLMPSLEKHHGVRIREKAIQAAVKLTERYLPAGRLPDKAISILDTACSRVALAQNARPEQIERLENEQIRLEQEIHSHERESSFVDDAAQHLPELVDRLTEVRVQIAQTQQQWDKEQALVQEMNQLQQQLEDQHTKGETSLEPAMQQRYLSCRQMLEASQGESGLIPAVVEDSVIAEVLSSWTGIPLGNIVSDEMERLTTLEDSLATRVIGQKQALKAITQSLRVARAGLVTPDKPIGVFFLCGPSGTGKTETCLALADILFTGEQDMITINMSEFKEEHKVSMLLGAPAGYVGYGEGGVLTEAVRRSPHCVLMLDEFEKAHPSVHDIFYRIFDKGRISDSEGREVDFRNTLIILTSNAAARDISEACIGKSEQNDNLWPNIPTLLETIRPSLEQYFASAFLGRVEVIPFYPLTREQLKTIGRMGLNKLSLRVKDHYSAAFFCEDQVLEMLVNQCDDPNIGARAIEHTINRVLLPQLAATCIQKLGAREQIKQINVSLKGDNEVTVSIPDKH